MKRVIFLSMLMLFCSTLFAVETKEKCSPDQNINIGVFYKNGVYKNDEFGFAFAKPQGWRFYALTQDITSFIDFSTENDETQMPENKISLSHASFIENGKFLLFSLNPENRNLYEPPTKIVFSIEPASISDERKVLEEKEKSYKQWVKKSFAKKKVKSKCVYKIEEGFAFGDKTFPYLYFAHPSSLSYFNDYDNMEEKFIDVVMNRGCYNLVISLTYFHDEQKEEMLRVLNSFIFYN